MNAVSFVSLAVVALALLVAPASATIPFFGTLKALGPLGDVYITVQPANAVYTHKIWYQVQTAKNPTVYGPKTYIKNDQGAFVTNYDAGFTKNLGKFNPTLSPVIAEVVFGIDVFETSDISGTPKWVWQTGGPNAGTNDGLAHAKFLYQGTDILVSFEDRPAGLPDRPEGPSTKDYNDCVILLRGVAAI